MHNESGAEEWQGHQKITLRSVQKNVDSRHRALNQLTDPRKTLE